MKHTILMTQCLQNDFVRPLGRYASLPNMLHVGYEEALRLMGERPDEGPIAKLMHWAYRQPEDVLSIIHIRDWHDADDAFQQEHFRQFGVHCLKESDGAGFAFPIPEEARQTTVINSPGLNDFVGTDLEAVLEPFADQEIRVGLAGVWTEAKIFFLAYDLRSRYPNMRLAVCSALTASSSRAHHFMALEQMERLLGVKVYASIGEFTRFLQVQKGLSDTDDARTIPPSFPRHADWPQLHFQGTHESGDVDELLLRYLFRDCREVTLRVLDGGFSGNLVFGSDSIDLQGYQQAPYVVKIGPQEPIGQEREAFEQIEKVLGNNAPRITEFADFGGRGALKYRYAAMGGGFANTFQKLYCGGLPRGKVEYYLSIVFRQQLGRFYKAATLEAVNLLKYYWFKPEWAPQVRKSVERVLGRAAEGTVLSLPGGKSFPNPCVFYERELARLLPLAEGSSYFSYVHGDLNGANIIVDSHENVWLIDFFSHSSGTRAAGFDQLENDLLYIFTPVNTQEELDEAVMLTDVLLRVEDLRLPLPDVEHTGLTLPEMRRTYETICFLRSFYPLLIHDDRNPLQLLIGQLRYAAHTLTFDESNHWQKLWALYTAGCCSAQMTKRLKESGPLRVDWLDSYYTQPGRLGLTILPGRKDYKRTLAEDLDGLRSQGVTHIIPLITHDEFHAYGVDALADAYRQAGFKLRHQPIFDQRVCSLQEMQELIGWMLEELQQGASIVLHCVGGLGRSGLVAACYLKARGLSPGEAIAEVRRARSPRAVESSVQEEFVQNFQLSSP